MTTRQVLVGCEFVYQASRDTPAVFQVQPLADQKPVLADERWTTDPERPTRIYHDLYGNACLRVMLPAGRSVLTYDAVATVPDATEDVDLDAPELLAQDLPDDVLLYTLPSRYVLPDVLGREAWGRFGTMAPGYRRVQAICDYVFNHLEFQYGSSTPLSTAADGLRRLPRLHPSGDLALPGPEHPRPVRVRVPAGDRGHEGTVADGLRRLDGGVPG
jgi:transglutaminase-like putative cysteine protease